ncbi:hypothetical protein RJG79_05605 [Mycoplasmatota bacterium WC44]
MKKEFININLLPRYIPNKYISYIINIMGLIILITFLLFYLVYMPYMSANSDLAEATFENKMIKNEVSYIQGLLVGEELDGSDSIYIDTIEYVESTEIPLRLRISELYSLTPNGATFESITYSMNDEFFSVNVTVDSDETLLIYIESIWKMYWVKDIQFNEAGPGSIALQISFEAGE